MDFPFPSCVLKAPAVSRRLLCLTSRKITCGGNHITCNFSSSVSVPFWGQSFTFICHTFLNRHGCVRREWRTCSAACRHSAAPPSFHRWGCSQPAAFWTGRHTAAPTAASPCAPSSGFSCDRMEADSICACRICPRSLWRWQPAAERRGSGPRPDIRESWGLRMSCHLQGRKWYSAP